MAIPALVAGAGLASRGLASYLAKQKAKKEMMKAGYGATRNASIPSLVSTQRNPGVFAKRAGLAAIPVVAGTTAGIMQGGDRARQEGTYMANPMMGISQNPSYDASMTREGQIQTMMEEMDGMNLSEEAKRQIIQDKLGINYGYLEDRDVEAGYGGDRFDKGYEFPSVANPLYHQSAYDKAVAEGQLMSKEYNIMKQGRNATGAGMTSTEMKAAAFNRIANDPSIPMDQRITAALRRETGAAFNPEEAIMMKKKLEAMDAERRNATGAGMTANEMRMFMGIPQ